MDFWKNMPSGKKKSYIILITIIPIFVIATVYGKKNI